MTLTPEQLKEKIEEETNREPPEDVLNDFRLILIAAKHGQLSLLKQMCPDTGRVYYVLAQVVNENMRSLAVIPERITAEKFVGNYDQWMDQVKASAESDPDWHKSTGTKQ